MPDKGLQKIIRIGSCILLCLATGWISSLFQADALAYWYPLLNKSSLTPPNPVFPIAWSILYVCMGISLGLLLSSNKSDNRLAIRVFAAQLLLNFSWSIVFFRLQSPTGALIILVAMLILLILYAIITHRKYRLSSILFYPYILWTIFAGYLNAFIVFYN